MFLKRQAVTSICDDIVHSLDELNRRAKLNPPVVLFSLQPVCIETGHVLHCRQERWWVCLKMRNIYITAYKWILNDNLYFYFKHNRWIKSHWKLHEIKKNNPFLYSRVIILQALSKYPTTGRELLMNYADLNEDIDHDRNQIIGCRWAPITGHAE